VRRRIVGPLSSSTSRGGTVVIYLEGGAAVPEMRGRAWAGGLRSRVLAKPCPHTRLLSLSAHLSAELSIAQLIVAWEHVS